MQVLSRALGHALLEQQGGGLELWIGLEAPVHGALEQHGSQRQEAHALVVGHERLDHRRAAPQGQARAGEVQRLVQAIATRHAHAGQRLQIAAGLGRRHQQRQSRCIGGDDDVVTEPALQAKAWNAERAVLIVQLRVQGVVARLGYAPGQAELAGIIDLARHGGLAGLIQQGARVTGHDQQWHEVLEHRAGPRQQHRDAAAAGQQAAEGEPAFLWQLALGNHDEVGQPRLRGQQVVVGAIKALLIGVVTDGQQVALRVVEKGEVHVCQVARQYGQAFYQHDSLHGAGFGLARRRLLVCRPVVGIEGCQLPPGEASRAFAWQEQAGRFGAQIPALRTERL